MKIKTTAQYLLYDNRKSLLIFYGIIAAIIAVLTLMWALPGGDGQGSGSGLEMATVVFLFVLGMNAFKEPFRILMQNGVSRRTHVLSFALFALCLAAATALLDGLWGLLMPLLVRYQSLYEMTMLTKAAGLSGFLMRVLWSAAANLLALCLGFFITTLYYRMNRALKLIVSIGVPVLLMIVLPMVDAFYFNFAITLWVGRTLGILMRTSVRCVGTFTVASAALLGLSFLLARRAVVKD